MQEKAMVWPGSGSDVRQMRTQPNNDTFEKKTKKWHLLDGGSTAALRSEAAAFERDDRIDGLWKEGSGRVKHACASAQRVKKGK